MSAIDRLLAANQRFAQTVVPRMLGARPRLRLAVLACMDARLDVERCLGLEAGDAHVIRNAGGLATDDALRSLLLSQRLLGTEEVALIHHTRCGLLGLREPEVLAQIEAETGERPPFPLGGFADLEEALRRGVETVRGCPFLPHRDRVRGFIYDVDTGRLLEPD